MKGGDLVFETQPAGLGEVEFRPPVITTERLFLRGWEPEDVDSVFRYASDPEVTRYMDWERHRSLDDSWVFLDHVIARQYVVEAYSYAVCLRERPWAALGGIGVVWEHREHEVMELGYVLARSEWGKGYVVEAALALLSRVFLDLKPQHVFAPVFADNARSCRVCEKLGMHLDGVRRQVRKRGENRHDLAFYSLLKDEWERR
jgi:ribosomal-protein-alanine N-acetyltransferase